MTQSAEDTVRTFFACYTKGRPGDFAEVVANGYLDYGHQPPGQGPVDARANYDHAVAQVGGIPRYTIDMILATARQWRRPGPAPCLTGR